MLEQSVTEIIPAILPNSLEELRGQLSRIQSAVHVVQIDVVDGIFAPNKTWGTHLEEIQLPPKEAFAFEIDLMATEPEEVAEAWQKAGVARIIIHADAPGAREALMALRFEEAEKEIQAEGGTAVPAGEADPAFLIGIALPSTATLDQLKEFENLYDYVQVMGIEKVGFQGQPFDYRAIELVRTLRQKYPTLEIQVDGAVNEQNIQDLVEAGADRLVVGSAIWKSKDPKEAIETLRQLANQ